MVISKVNTLGTSLVAAAVSVLFGMLIFLSLDPLSPFVFLLSPFFLILSLPVGLPILYCWRLLGRKVALWAASFSIFFLYFALPSHFAIMMVLQLVVPAAFIACIADLRMEHAPKNRNSFIPLSAILSATTLFIAITTLILTFLLNNTPSLALLLDNSISEIVHILTQMRALPQQQISQIELLLRQDHRLFIVNIFAFYSFVVTLTNFYIAARLKKDLSATQRPRDEWPYSASSLPRIQVFLLVGATILSWMPIHATLQNCLDVISMVLLLSFTATGLAAIHLSSRGKARRTLLLSVLYGMLILPFTSLFLAFWGIFVSSTPFLHRYKNNFTSHF